MFDTEILAALGRALSDDDSDIRSSAVKFFTAAIVEGVISCFHIIFKLK